MKRLDIKQIVKEEITLQRRRLLAEGVAQQAPAPAAPAPAVPQAQPQQQQQAPQPPQPEAPTSGLNPNKAKGIIAGAIKTLINSGALQGVDLTSVEKITADVLSNLTKTAPTYVASSVPPTQPEVGEDELSDESLSDQPTYSDQNDELDDQSQYDPSLEKTISTSEPTDAPEDEPEDEPLFEVKDFAALLK